MQAAVKINTTSLPPAQVSVPYTATLDASGGPSPFLWSVAGGQLPSGLTLTLTGLIAGVPTRSGSYSFSVRVTDAKGENDTQGLSITVADPPPPLLVSTSSLPDGLTGRHYTQTLAAAGGVPPYQWSIAAGTLPPGLGMNAAGVIDGTPTAAGRADFAVRVTDTAGVTAVRPLSIVVAQGVILSTASLPQGTVGVAYSQTVAASGGTPPYVFSVSGSLPAGLSLTGNTVSGTPTAAGTASFTLQVTDAAGGSASGPLSITIAPPPVQITTSALPAGTVGAPYSQALTVTGGAPPYTWSITTGSLPQGLSLTGATIAGTPAQAGSFQFTVRVSDASTNASAQLSLTINAPLLQITTTSLPDATVNVPYQQQAAAQGGTPPYTWTVTGALPAGLSLSGNAIGGTPTAAGTATFTLQVTDAGGATASRQLSLSVRAPALQITTTSLPDANVGVAYQQSLAASGGTPPYTWTVTGTLPAGLSLSGAAIAGTPTAPGSGTFTARVTDAAGASDSRQLSITVRAAALLITTGTLPEGSVGTPYQQSLTATGGTPPYTWTVRGNLPAGLSLSGSNISGIPSAPGTSAFTVQVTDAAKVSASQQLSITVRAPALQITTAALSAAIVGVHYAQPLSVSGGVAPFTWSASGNLPPGLSITGASIAGTPTAAGVYSFTLQVNDAASQNAAANFSITVSEALTITTVSLSDAAVGVPYSQQLKASGGTPPYMWSVASGTLPAGLTLDGTAGTISGTPQTTGTASFSIQVTDRTGAQASRSYTVVTASGLTITSAPVMPAGTAGRAYAQTVSAAGGRSPYTWSVSAGTLPGGITLDASTGSIAGTPGASGEFAFTLQARDSTGATASKAFTLSIAAALLISSAPTLPDGVVGTPYSQPLAAAGGTPPYAWSVVAGSLPPGLQIDPAAGMISGTPSAAENFRFTVQVSDSTGANVTKEFSTRIAGALLIETSSLTGAVLATPYSQALAASGGLPPYRWSILGGSLPAGLALDPATGAIAGTPSAAGTFHFTVQVTDAAGLTSARDQALAVLPAALPPISIDGPADKLDPMQQPTLNINLGAPYAAQITGRLSLSFAPDSVVAADDPAVQFATGGRTASFTVPANSTSAAFPIPSMAFQTGTVAGVITISAALESGGADITPAGGIVRTMRVDRSEPKIRAAAGARNGAALQLNITGFSTTRELTGAQVTFAAAPGANLQTTQLTVPLADAASKWFQDPAGIQFGSQFTLSLPFTVQGEPGSIASATVRLINQSGTSQPVTITF